MGWPRATRGQDERTRRACQWEAVGEWESGESGEWVSRAVAVGSWQAIRHARRMGGSLPTAGEEWREGGDRAPPHV